MGDDADAKALVGELVEGIPGMRWVDCGGLQMARIAETLTPLLISMNRRTGAGSGPATRRDAARVASSSSGSVDDREQRPVSTT